MLFWVPQTKVGPPSVKPPYISRNIIIRNIIAYSTHSTPIWIRSNAENVFISNVHVQNFGGSYGGIAIGGIGGSSNVVVRDSEVVTTMPGNVAAGCANVYGAVGKIVFQNFRCVTRHRTMLTLGAGFYQNAEVRTYSMLRESELVSIMQ